VTEFSGMFRNSGTSCAAQLNIPCE
jgi:hypothetical protein